MYRWINSFAFWKSYLDNDWNNLYQAFDKWTMQFIVYVRWFVSWDLETIRQTRFLLFELDQSNFGVD